ncbi:hypothetical protein Pan110_16710 [Gimesia panareensis]|nr:hypothetical protein Pan110_16710 [Gimesia panareensis]
MICRCLLSLLLLTSLVGILQADPFPLEAVKPLVPSPDETRAIIILREWSELHRDCTSVRGKIYTISYDDFFEIERHGEGYFEYSGPKLGYWKRHPPINQPDSEQFKKSAQGKPYQYEAVKPESWYWLKDRMLFVNEAQRIYSSLLINKHQQRQHVWDFAYILCQYDADHNLGFLPGAPNQARFRQWIQGCQFKVTNESETHIWIDGTILDKELSKDYSHIQLYLEKSPLRLRAVKRVHFEDNRATLYLFSEVDFDPLPWAEPDLTGYQGYREEQVEWPVEARRPKPTQ